MPREARIDRVKRVRSRGKTYLYFVTARTNPEGNPILVRLPPQGDAKFWDTYAALMAAVTKAQRLDEQLLVPAFVRLYQNSPKFKGLAPGSQRLYGIYLRHFVEQFSGDAIAPADEIRRKDILHVAEQMNPGAANAFVRAVGALYAWGRKRGHVEADPCKDIDPNELGEHEPWPEAMLVAGLNADDPQVRLAVHLLFYTAQRIGDVCAMRWTDIAGGVIRMRQGKTGRDMVIPIHSALAAELARHPRSFDTILSYKGRRLKDSTLRNWITRFTADAGHRCKPHGLRKNAVNALLEAGCSVGETAAISGQSLAMVEHYSKRRSQMMLGSAAILKWEQGHNRNRKA